MERDFHRARPIKPDDSSWLVEQRAEVFTVAIQRIEVKVTGVASGMQIETS